MRFAPQRSAIFRHRASNNCTPLWCETHFQLKMRNDTMLRQHPWCVLYIWLQNVLRATAACHLSTSQLPKVVWAWCVLYKRNVSRLSWHFAHLYLISSNSFFLSSTLLFSSTLFFSAFHLSILSEVWLLTSFECESVRRFTRMAFLPFFRKEILVESNHR